jgi:hypothetical protein
MRPRRRCHRLHATTNEIPAARLITEAQKLQPLPPPYTARSIRSLCTPPSERKAIVGYQHPLSVYDALFPEVQP